MSNLSSEIESVNANNATEILIHTRNTNQKIWINEQLTLIREAKHAEFSMKQATSQSIPDANTPTKISNESDNNASGNTEDTRERNLWPPNTILFTGVSIEWRG